MNLQTRVSSVWQCIKKFNLFLATISVFSGALAEEQAQAITDQSKISLQADKEFGEYLASECLTCHRTDGTSKGIPSITNLPMESFADALRAYRRGERSNSAMQTVAARLSDEEIAALAAFFAQMDENGNGGSNEDQ
ncbi:c-type cytochrome [Algicella marina]|uniref:C-type cytochrome n=1 Tax=Algicella marina TaxID=2683284 RepID=A0A6P1T6L8_9RHOB|nr:c-type cytochrome [Algicella marina]QHQ36909.1 c-type cytochrome [Algicella marina]